MSSWLQMLQATRSTIDQPEQETSEAEQVVTPILPGS